MESKDGKWYTSVVSEGVNEGDTCNDLNVIQSVAQPGSPGPTNETCGDKMSCFLKSDGETHKRNIEEQSAATTTTMIEHMEEVEDCYLRRGQYLGEISALCFLHLPPHLSSLPYLIAGTGSQILVYDLASGVMIQSFEVFNGVRVHGISLGSLSDHSSDSTTAFKIAVFGERRVKLFSLLITSQTHQPESLHLSLTLMHSVPRLSHWVLDVAFFYGNHCLSIGCSDNSVYFWDILRCKVLSQVSCSERCLLYSMRIWGNEVDSLRVASGTIFNEVIVWKLDCKNDARAFGSPAMDHVNLTNEKGIQLPDQPYTAVNLYRLIGHEGSIFRLAWSPDGSKIVSVSDDRSARVWVLDESKCLPSHGESPNQCVSSVLFGHTARIWDCCIFDPLIVTAGEDCTCRVWGLDGTQLNLIKEHIGRGVWRCVYDPKFSLLVTAGFDSALKVHHLQSLPDCSGKTVGALELPINEKETFKLSIPNSTEHVGHMDSKSEYVRCLHFSREDSIFIATNNGYVYHAKLCPAGDVSWTELLHIGEDAPIICMDMLSNWGDPSCGIDDWVAVGDGNGRMTIAHLTGDVCSPKVEHRLTWSAEIERQLLGNYWCKSMGYRFIFTVDPRGRLKLWRLWNPLSSVSHVKIGYRPELVSEFVSCFGMRIICLDASLKDEVLVCGDIRGNVLLFPLKKDLYTTPICLEENVSPLTYFKGAHGISTVCSISIVDSTPSQLDIHSTGGDGCICYFEYDRHRTNLEFTGIKQVKELSTIQSVYSNADCDDNLPSGSYAIGFASSEFIIWNLSSERKVVQILCGGWRRPHSYYLGRSPEMKNCFAFVKDGIIYIHRYWVTENEREIYPKNLHLQFHGREIHSLSFISPDLLCNPNGKQSHFSEPSWIATGCEDGTVRLTRYEPETESWLVSILLGEHVGGSAVRSICSLSKIHRIMLKATDMSERVQRRMGNLEDQENLLLLVSVGAKRVITAWKQKISLMGQRIEPQYCKQGSREGSTFHGSSSSKKFSPLTFQWLSSDMPTRDNNCIRENTDKIIKATENDQSLASKDRKMESKPYLLDRCENDWRYLAVTAFLAKGPDSRTTVCFIVVACSDATLSLRALILPHRLWFDVALLTPLSSPVLALQHVIVPKHLPSEENIQIGDLYIVISGSTDGSIALWDLTEHVENFMQLLSAIEMEKGIDNQKRPRTGRGSQGGRWWRSLGSHVSKRRPGGEWVSSDPSLREKGENGSSLKMDKAYDTSLQNMPVCSQGNHGCRKEKTDISSLDTYEIGPLHVFNDMHQSGVNCLHVSHVKKPTASDSVYRFCVLSGGDDQSLNCLTFVFTSIENLQLLNLEADVSPSGNMENHRMGLLSVDKIMSAHSSAVKGVWTDGMWVFSTGLDQRVRCWNIEQGKLIERAHLVISVPEPEALDARPCDRDHYQIAVAGRGMQFVDFFAPGKINVGN